MKAYTDENIETRRVHISGKVQGVFFRSNMKNVADSLGVKGWVRNLKDGNVEAVVQGRLQDLERIMEWCRMGPKMARVEEIEVTNLSTSERFRNFVILS